MQYIKVREAAYVLKVTTIRVRQLAQQGRLIGAAKFGRDWAIPLTEEGTIRVSRKSRGIPLRVHREEKSSVSP